MMPDPTPLILELSNAYRAQLLARERQAATALVYYYGQAWQRLQTDISTLQTEIDAQRAAGEEPTIGKLWRLERMQAIQAQADAEMARFAQFADTTIGMGQREAMAAGERNAYELIRAAFPADVDVGVSFATMPREAAEQMIGFLQDGSPLVDVLTKHVGKAAKDLGNTMVTGIVAGWNPRKLAREMRSAFGMGLTKALQISRTEQLRAYREATRNTYKENSHVVKAWERHAQHDTRTCIACLMLDGTRYALEEAMDDHVQGRCAMLPVTKTYAELGIEGVDEPDFTREKGADWFQRQSEADQVAIMGRGRWDAWQAGQFKLEDVPKLVKSDVWGNAWVPKSLRQLELEAEGITFERESTELAPRPISQDEQELQAELDETLAYYEQSGDEGVRSYLDNLRESLKAEQEINEALWQEFGFTPDEATEQDWLRLADTVERDGYKLYLKYTKEGITQYVAEERGAKDSGYMVVGSQQVRVKQGAFSVRTAQRLEGTLWQEAKEDLSQAAGELLQRAGFAPGDIAQANYEQRVKLLEELGQKQMITTARGKPSKIDAVEADARARVIERVDFDLAATCESSAMDPLSMPTIDAYQKFDLAERIRQSKVDG